jgi:hypothetical protein
MADQLAFDASDFLAGLKLADLRVQRGGRRATALLLAQGEKRGKELCPIREGTLLATIEGDGRAIVVTDEKIEGRLMAGGGEAADYAVRQHEVPMAHSHPVSGVYASKYIETPMKELSTVGGQVYADEIRKEMDA